MNLTESELTISALELRAFLLHVSKDETRDHLASVAINRKAGWVAATDGHRLLRWQGQPCGEGTLLLRGSKLAKLLAFAERAPKRKRRGEKPQKPPFVLALGKDEATVSALGVKLAFPYLVGREYPPIEQVIPAYEPGAPQGGTGLDPRYLADLVAVSHAAHENAPQSIFHYRTRGVLIQNGPGELDPVLVRYCETPEWTSVIMPMRVDGGWDVATTKAKAKK